MFTGIVETTGVVRSARDRSGGRRLRIEAGALLDEVSPGDSISVNGVCLTVEELGDAPSSNTNRGEGSTAWFSTFLAAETLDRTYLGELRAGDEVNLELAMSADGRFDGHLVQGHVDGTATVEAIEPVGEDHRFRFSLPEDLRPYVVEKGSIAVDGISLTIADLDTDGAWFEVAIIPATAEATTLAGKAVGDPVHLEVDVLAKYVERVLEERAGSG